MALFSPTHAEYYNDYTFPLFYLTLHWKSVVSEKYFKVNCADYIKDKKKKTDNFNRIRRRHSSDSRIRGRSQQDNRKINECSEWYRICIQWK